MDSEYLKNGEVVRAKIALDIKYRKLKGADLKKLVVDPIIKSAFFGASYNDKKPRSAWNKEYLDLLSYAAIGESFNQDYLLYLDAVADHVVKIKQKKFILAGITFVVIIVIIAGVVYISTTKGQNV